MDPTLLIAVGHRKALLGSVSSGEELAFLRTAGSGF